jgi:hypothetical protein
MAVIFNSTTIGTVLINVGRIPASTFASCYGTSDESPGKSLEERRKNFTFPGLLQDLIDIMVDAPGTLGRQLSELLGSQVIVNGFGSALAVFRWSPAENVVVVIVDNLSGSNGLGGLVRKGGGYKLKIPSASAWYP